MSTLERWTHTAGVGLVGGILEYIDAEVQGKTSIGAFSVKRTAGASNRVYEFAVWRDTGSGYALLSESAKRVDVGSNEVDVSLLSAEEIQTTYKYKVRVRNTVSTDDIQATSGTLIINT